MFALQLSLGIAQVRIADVAFICGKVPVLNKIIRLE